MLLFSDSNGTANLILRVNKKGKIHPRMYIVLKIGTLITMSLWLFCKCEKCTQLLLIMKKKKTFVCSSCVCTHKSIPVHFSIENEMIIYRGYIVLCEKFE